MGDKVEKLTVKIKKLKDNAIIPSYQTSQSAGMDLHACIDEPIVIQPLGRSLIPTGLLIELPDGYESQIRARSGMALKHGITMANGIGTIDADYRGEYGVMLFNVSDEPFTVEPDMRIAQLVVNRYEQVVWREVDIVSETERGSGGFGSTGIIA